ncbi:MAG: hypothetical protein V1750_08580 [Acidobacteriota bacterium]
MKTCGNDSGEGFARLIQRALETDADRHLARACPHPSVAALAARCGGDSGAGFARLIQEAVDLADEAGV